MKLFNCGLLLAFGLFSHVASTVTYSVENFSERAKRMMMMHDDNAVYNIEVDGVCQYLPIAQPIKRKAVKRMNHPFVPAKTAVKIVRNLILTEDPRTFRQNSKKFFGSMMQDFPHTYVITDDRLIFTRSTDLPLAEKYRDRFSKHYFISNTAKKVRYSGEMFIYKDERNGNVFVILDNSSGTYKPSAKWIPQLKKLLEHNFSEDGLYFLTKEWNQGIDQEKLFLHSEPFYSKQ